MKKEIVKIKSFPNGLHIILDEDIPFEELVEAVKKKFGDSASFFKNAKKAIKFSGRWLSDEEENILIDVIANSCDILISCILKENSEEDKIYLKAMEQLSNMEEQARGKFFKGTLRGGQVLESDSTIVVLGDVNAGARIISGANIVVLGTLYGEAQAGVKKEKNYDDFDIESLYGEEDEDESCFVVALDMKHPEVYIGDRRLFNSGKIPRKGILSKACALIAYDDDGVVVVKEITSEFLNKLPF